METLQGLESQVCNAISHFDYIQAWYNLDPRILFREEACQSETLEIDHTVPCVLTNARLFPFEQLLALYWHRRVGTTRR